VRISGEDFANLFLKTDLREMLAGVECLSSDIAFIIFLVVVCYILELNREKWYGGLPLIFLFYHAFYTARE
jgi:hypothetical protein